jgi:hypothetical protein
MSNIEQVRDPITDIFAPVYVDQSLEKYEYQQIRADDNSNIGNATIIKFQTKAINEYIAPSEAYLAIKFTIGKTNTTDAVALMNSAFSLFSQASLFIDEIPVEVKTECWSVIAHKLLSMGADELKASNDWFFLETGSGEGVITSHQLVSNAITTGASTTITNVNVQVNANYNEGFQKRVYSCSRNQSTTGSEVYVWCKLRDLFTFLTQEKLFKGNRFAFEFYRNSNTAQIMQKDVNGTDNGTLVLNDCTLWLPTVRPNAIIEKDILSGITSGNKVNLSWTGWETVKITESTVSNNPVNIVHRVATKNNKIKAVCVFGQLTTRDTAQEFNKGIFPYTDFPVTQAKIMVNNKAYPLQTLTFTDQYDTARAYQMYVEASGRGINDAAISFEQFRRNYFMLYFDVSKTDNSVFSSINISDITSEITLANGVARNIYYMIYSEKSATLEPLGGSDRMRFILN